MLAASSAIADTVLLLKRGDYGVVLYARGRDIEGSETMLEFDRSSCRWNIVRSAGVVTKSEARAAVLGALSSSLKPMSAVEIATETGRSRDAIDILLHRMIADEEIRRVGRGRYSLADSSQLGSQEFRWADGTVIARFCGKNCKIERLDRQEIGASTESDDFGILQKDGGV